MSEQVDLTIRLDPAQALSLRDLLASPNFRLTRLEFRPQDKRLSKQDYRTGTILVKVADVEGVQW